MSSNRSGPTLDERVASMTRFGSAAALSERLDRAPGRVKEAQVLYRRGCAQRCLNCFLGERPEVDGIGVVEALCEDLLAVGIRPVVYPSDPLLPTGDPAKDRDTFGRLLRLHQAIRQKIILFTGLRLDETVVAALRESGPPKLYLSLHGATAGSHDWFTRRPESFQEVERALETLAREVPAAKLGVNVVLHRRNVGELEELVEYAVRRGVSAVFLISFKPLGEPVGGPLQALKLNRRDHEHVARTVRSLRSRHGGSVRIQLGTGLSPDFHTSGIYRLLAQRRTYCRAGRQRVAIDPVDLVVYPCMVLSGRPEVAIGRGGPARRLA